MLPSWIWGLITILSFWLGYLFAILVWAHTNRRIADQSNKRDGGAT